MKLLLNSANFDLSFLSFKLLTIITHLLCLKLTIISLKTWLIQIISKNRLALLKSILRQIEKVKNETVLVDGNHEYFNIFELFKSLN
jgi:hypothetical protein